jgi:glycosyltransferase involved in cell wall biosynthesis
MDMTLPNIQGTQTKNPQNPSTLSDETSAVGLPTLGMGLIVKNEENDLPACLASFLPAVDAVVIIDTGSTDRTLEFAHAILKGSGKKYSIMTYLDANDEQGRLCDFSAARNQYVKALSQYSDIDFAMSVDADDTLTTPDIRGALKAQPADYYSIKYRMNPGFWFQSYKIWRNGIGAKYQGRVHECLAVDWRRPTVHLDSVEFQHHFTEYPNQENGTARNLRILRAEVYPPLRSLFYFANENSDAKNYLEAIKWYREYIRRATVGGENHWPIELAHCYFRAARWLQHLGRSDEAVDLSLELLARDSSWSESWCELAYIAKLRGEYGKMKEYCHKALMNKFTPRLFSEADKYHATPMGMLATVPAGITGPVSRTLESKDSPK